MHKAANTVLQDTGVVTLKVYSHLLHGWRPLLSRDMLGRQSLQVTQKIDNAAAASAASCTPPQTLGFKTLSLLVLPSLEPAPAAVVRGYVTARHNAVLERCAGIEAELADLKALVCAPGCAGWLSCMSCCATQMLCCAVLCCDDTCMCLERKCVAGWVDSGRRVPQ